MALRHPQGAGSRLVQHPAATLALVVVNVFLATLALYLLQEGRAQQANPSLGFFIDFPMRLLPLAYAALGIAIANFAIVAMTAWRRLPKRRWPYVMTLLAVVALGVLVAEIGLDGVRAIVDPSSKPAPGPNLQQST